MYVFCCFFKSSNIFEESLIYSFWRVVLQTGDTPIRDVLLEWSVDQQSCRSGAFVILSERQRPGQGRPVGLAVSAGRAPPVMK